MNPVAQTHDAADVIAKLLDPARVERLLAGVIDWAPGVRPRQVAVERCWPTRSDGLAFEWSFDLGDGRRRALYGTTGVDERHETLSSRCRAVPTAGGIRDVCVFVRAWNLVLHSPDRDPGMPHLRECLDGLRMADRLAPLWSRLDGRCAAVTPRVHCRPLGYRAGRRAAVAYCPSDSTDVRSGLIGKTFRNGRAAALAERHVRLNEQLAWATNGRVRVPAVVERIPDLRMTLFSRAPGHVMGTTHRWTARQIERLVDVLAVLHNTPLAGLSTYSVADERAVVRRWYDVLRRVLPAAAGEAERRVETLLQAVGGIDATTRRTVHRDFYERQIVLGRRSVILLDLDTLALGHPCVDLGNLAAHLTLARLMAGDGASGEDGTSADTFLRQYERSMGPVDRRTFAFYHASALFRVGAVHALRTRTRRFTAALWRQADRVLVAVSANHGRIRVPSKPTEAPVASSTARTAPLATES